MRKLKLSILLVWIVSWLSSLPGFAVELNSGNVTQAPFNCATDAVDCDLSNLNITGLAVNTFVNHSGLINLNLSNNEITSIDMWDLNWLSNLIDLQLFSNNIVNIDVDSFVGLQDLIELNLYNNQIVNLSGWVFSWLSNLTWLYLNNNNINNISSWIFMGLNNISVLLLQSNELCTIEEWSFDDLINISDFNIWVNYLERSNLGFGVLSFLDINDSDWEDSQITWMCNNYNIWDYFDVNLAPDSQNAISWTIVSFGVTVTNNTWMDVYLLQEFPNGVSYSNATAVPLNNPALMLGIETNPIWLLSSWETLNIQIEAVVELLSFTGLEVFSNIVDIDDENLVYTSAVSMIEPIGDILVEKTLIWDEPQLTWDDVLYSVMISNIGSMEVTWVEIVDVWPSDALSFPNQASVNGTMQVPTIYNGIANNYLFEIWDLIPGQMVEVLMTWTMDLELSVWQEFINTAFVLVDQDQYNTGNDTSTVVNHVLWLADVYVDITQVSTNPTMIWDKVVYDLVYWNMWTNWATWVELKDRFADVVSFESASIQPDVENNGELIWNIWMLTGGYNWEIILTWVFVWWAQVWNVFVNTGEISTSDIESDYENNIDIVTWEVMVVSDLGIKLHATNLTDDSRNIDPDTNINAISGDVVLLEIFVNNSGNVIETETVSISNIGGFVWYNGLTSWDITISPQTNQNIVLTWIVWPQNFVSFSPVANLSYSGVLLSDDVMINEPLSCGDGLITQTEMCDTNGQIWDMLPGQHCEDIAGMCTIVTDGILNVVNMEYTTYLWTWFLTDSVLVDYEMALPDMQCNSLTSDFGVVIVDEDNQWDMEFTCNTVDGLQAQEIKIVCENGDEWVWYNTNNFVYNCNYEYDEDGWENNNLYTVQCFVNDSNVVNDNCEKTIAVWEWFYGVCGDWELDDGEECDYEDREDDKVKIGYYLNDNGERYRSYDDEWNYCKRCKIRDDENNYVYQPPQCLMVNTTISIMEDELMPFWWRLWERDNLRITSDDNYCEDVDYDEEHTIINKDSMECNFAVYNGKDYQQKDEEPIGTFKRDCFDKDNGNMFDYFYDIYNVNFNRVSGRMIKDITNLLDENIDTYGEYKLVLKDVEYQYCNPETKDWDDGRLYEWICEVDFALTKPYITQISTLGVSPTATSDLDFLEDFYAIDGTDLVDRTDIRNTMEVDWDDYEFDSATTIERAEFKKKYEPLAISVNGTFEVWNNKTINDIFGGANVKKVPNKFIFFVDWNGGELVLKQLTDNFPWTPFTIYVEWMNIKVEWDVLTNGMILTDQKIYFEDEEWSDGRCDEWWQVVQWIFVAKDWFDAEEKMRNRDEDEERCAWGNLHVKWVLIWWGLDDLMKKKRSHLNDWFNSTTINENKLKRERRSEIFQGASVLIEYNPELWDDLPPGAELFVDTLDVYKR